MEKLIFVLFAIFCIFMGVFFWACGGIQFPRTIDGAVYDFGKGPVLVPSEPDKISLLTWNISYAYGFGSSGQGYTAHSRDDFQSRLEQMGEIIRGTNADIILLQEVDFNSRRSCGVDQMRELARASGLRYAAPAVTWRAGYVPFPLWRPKDHFGRMLSGGAVLSRYPIISNRVRLFPKPAKNHWWYNLFYLFRFSQEAQIQAGGKTYLIINNHLEAFNMENRMQQARAIAAEVAVLPKEDRVVIIGGDMNALPPCAAKRFAFSDGTGNDYRGDKTIDILNSIAGFKDVIPLNDYCGNEAAYFSFPSHSPNRRLDYLFVPQWVEVSGVRIISAGTLSDHLPVLAQLDVSKGGISVQGKN